MLAGVATNVVPAVATDAAMHSLGVFPPLQSPEQFTSPLCLIALAYRCVYGVAGGFLTARLAPIHPLAHAIALGGIGVVASTAGAIAMWGVGPNWYPIALVISALPCSWWGAKLASSTQGQTSLE
jgi:hypothetical protein